MRSDTVPATTVLNEQMTLGQQLEGWERHLAGHYDVRVDVGKLSVPELPVGTFQRARLLVIPNRKKLSLNRIYAVCERSFPCYRYTADLDAAEAKSQKRPDNDYVVWTEGAVEPGEKHSNLTPDQLNGLNVPHQVIGERMLQGFKHWEETEGGQLDLINWTITASRDSGGYALDAGWYDRQFQA